MAVQGTQQGGKRETIEYVSDSGQHIGVMLDPNNQPIDPMGMPMGVLHPRVDFQPLIPPLAPVNDTPGLYGYVLRADDPIYEAKLVSIEKHSGCFAPEGPRQCAIWRKETARRVLYERDVNERAAEREAWCGVIARASKRPIEEVLAEANRQMWHNIEIAETAETLRAGAMSVVAVGAGAGSG